MRIRIVVPCYNEEARLNTAAFDAYLTAAVDVGFVMVNDGSRDATLRILEQMAARWPERVEVVDQQPNQGKAEAVRVGMLRAFKLGCDFAGFFDADLATPLSEIEELERVLSRNPGIEIALAARLRLLGRHIERNPVRHYLGRVFATVASLVLNLPVYDTQCGAKLFRAVPRTQQIFAARFRATWTFDVELLARFLQAGGPISALYEVPVMRWADIRGSKLAPRDFLRAIGEMALIYKTYHLQRDADRLLWFFSLPLVRYAGAGALGTAVHYLTLMLGVEIFEVAPARAAVVGALFGAAVNYVLNYHMTFASRAPHASALPRFFAVAALIAVVNWSVMIRAVNELHVHYLAAQLACTLLGVAAGFALNKIWTFAERGRTS